MKKMILTAAIAVFSLANINAQGEFNIGLGGGLPIGDAGDVATFSAVLDVNYLFEVSEGFTAGPALGLSYSFSEEVDVPFGDGVVATIDLDDAIFLPIGGAARYSLSDKFTVGADLGYALGINDGNDGGFYYSPRVQYGITETMDIVAAYRGIAADGGSFDVISLGIEFGL
ncbi:MAG: hypothetical protein AAF688_08815 [Bacteroidota bacterium]